MNAALHVAEGHCTGAWREHPYRETLALREGRVVTLRPAQCSDKSALPGFFTTMSSRSRLLRFHGTVKAPPDALLRAFTTQVSHQHVAMVAMVDAHDGPQRLVAEARYVVDKSAPGHAELAMSVADSWQGLGLGRAMLGRLARHATSEGLKVLVGSVLGGNESMLGLLRGLGASFHSQGSDVQATLAL
jgi:acetyltransferase